MWEVLEKIVSQWLNYKFENQKLMHWTLFEFRKSDSAIDAVENIVNKLEKNYHNKNKLSLLISLDIKGLVTVFGGPLYQQQQKSVLQTFSVC